MDPHKQLTIRTQLLLTEISNNSILISALRGNSRLKLKMDRDQDQAGINQVCYFNIQKIFYIFIISYASSL